MNTKQLQFNRQKVAALLLAGSILVVGLAWTDMSTNLAQWGAESEKAGSMEYNSGLSSELPFKSVKVKEGQLIAGGRGGIGPDVQYFKGGESGLSSESQYRLIAGRKPGIGMGDSQPPSKPS